MAAAGGDLIWERMALTLLLTVSAPLVTWGIALPVGVFSAVRKYSVADCRRHHAVLPGLAMPSFFAGAGADVYVAAVHFGQNVGGLFSGSSRRALERGQGHRPVAAPVDPGDPGRVRHGQPDPRDARQHARTSSPALASPPPAGQGPFGVHAAGQVPVRLALNPFISTIAWLLPNLVSGSIIGPSC